MRQGGNESKLNGMNAAISGETRMKNIAKASALLAVFTLLSRLLGLVRDRILAGNFGAGVELDSYTAAFSIPDFLFNLLIFGTLTAAFVPIFSRDLVQDREKAANFASVVYTVSVSAIFLLAVILFILAPQLVGLVFSRFSPEKQALTAQMARIMMFSPVLFTASNLAALLLQAHNRFLPTAISPILYNLGIIAGAVWFSGSLGIVGVAYGALLGAILHTLFNLISLKTIALRLRFVLAFGMAEMKELWRLYLPRLFAFDTFYIGLVVSLLVSQRLADGSLTIIKLASNAQAVPIGIFALSFVVAAFPNLSQTWALAHRDDFKRILVLTATQILFFVVPLSLLMFIMRAQIVRLLFGGPRFTWEDTYLTAQTLGVMVLSLFAQSLIPLLAKSFYATYNTKIPVFVSLFTAGLNVILAFVLSDYFGVVGIGLAMSAASLVGFVLLFVLLRRRVGRLNGWLVAERVLKILIASIVAATAAFAALYAVAPLLNTHTFFGLLLQTAAAAAVGLILYLIAGLLLNLAETRSFLSHGRAWLLRLLRPLNALVSYAER